MNNIYLISGVKAIVHEGRIYVEAIIQESAAAESAERWGKEVDKTEQANKEDPSGGRAVKKRKERVKIEPDDFKHMKEMITADYPVQEIATKFDVSAGYVYQIKTKMKKSGELKYETKV